MSEVGGVDLEFVFTCPPSPSERPSGPGQEERMNEWSARRFYATLRVENLLHCVIHLQCVPITRSTYISSTLNTRCGSVIRFPA